MAGEVAAARLGAAEMRSAPGHPGGQPAGGSAGWRAGWGKGRARRASGGDVERVGEVRAAPPPGAMARGRTAAAASVPSSTAALGSAAPGPTRPPPRFALSP